MPHLWEEELDALGEPAGVLVDPGGGVSQRLQDGVDLQDLVLDVPEEKKDFFKKTTVKTPHPFKFKKSQLKGMVKASHLFFLSPQHRLWGLMIQDEYEQNTNDHKQVRNRYLNLNHLYGALPR